MSETKRSRQMKRLRGKKLLTQLKNLNGLSKTEKARACGYFLRTKSGRERVQLKDFMNAILDAKGINLDAESDSIGLGRGRSLTYRVKVHGNGALIIGSGYTKKMGIKPGQSFDIHLGPRNIKLLATKAVN